MTTLLSEVGQRLLDRWMNLLVLPGLLFMAVAGVAVQLGHADALDVTELSDWVTGRLEADRSPSTGTVLLVAASVALAAAGAGLCAAALGRLLSTLWALPGDRPPLRRLTERRRRRWRRADRRLAAALGAAVTGTGDVGDALTARDRIALVEPVRLTWIGDRLTAPAVRVQARYGLDLAAAWPRLWLTIPDAARTELTAAHDSYASAARLAGWAVLYTGVAFVWWPSSLIAATLAVTARVQSRAAAVTLAELTEATVDLYLPDLAAQLRIPGELTAETGFAITAAVRKDHLPAPAQPASLTSRRERPSARRA